MLRISRWPRHLSLRVVEDRAGLDEPPPHAIGAQPREGRLLVGPGRHVSAFVAGDSADRWEVLATTGTGDRRFRPRCEIGGRQRQDTERCELGGLAARKQDPRIALDRTETRRVAVAPIEGPRQRVVGSPIHRAPQPAQSLHAMAMRCPFPSVRTRPNDGSSCSSRIIVHEVPSSDAHRDCVTKVSSFTSKVRNAVASHPPAARGQATSKPALSFGWSSTGSDVRHVCPSSEIQLRGRVPQLGWTPASTSSSVSAASSHGEDMPTTRTRSPSVAMDSARSSGEPAGSNRISRQSRPSAERWTTGRLNPSATTYPSSNATIPTMSSWLSTRASGSQCADVEGGDAVGDGDVAGSEACAIGPGSSDVPAADGAGPA